MSDQNQAENLAAVVAGLLKGGLTPGAAAKTAPGLCSILGGPPHDLMEKAEGWARSQTTGDSKPGAKDGDNAKGGDIGRAAKDPAYSAEWRKSDPDGWKRAWSDHNRRKMNDPMYRP